MRITETALLTERIFVDLAFICQSLTPQETINDLTSRYRLLRSQEKMVWFISGLMNGLIPGLNHTPAISAPPVSAIMRSTIILNSHQVQGLVNQAAIYIINPHRDYVRKNIKNTYSALSSSPVTNATLVFERGHGRYVQNSDQVLLVMGRVYSLGCFQEFLTHGFTASTRMTQNVFMHIFKSSIANV